MKIAKCCGEFELSVEYLERTARVLKLLAHGHRLKIVEILEGRDGVPVFEIAEKIGLAQAATSQHLNHMRRVGLVEAVRKGREVHYKIGDARALTILGCLRKGRMQA